MGYSSKGYSPQMRAVKGKLKKLGIPDTLFDADFSEQEERNRKDAEMLLARLREKEKNGEYEGMDLPWTDLRKQFESDMAEGKKDNYIATQPRVPNWKRSFDIAAYIWKSEVNQYLERQEREKNGKK